jgi:hypothetical protein
MSTWPVNHPVHGGYRPRTPQTPNEGLRVVEQQTAQSRRGLLYGLAFSLLAVNVFVAIQFGGYIRQLDTLRGEFSNYRRQTAEQLSRIGTQSIASNKTAFKGLTSLQTELDNVRRQLDSEAGQLKQEALRRVDLIATRFAQEQQRQGNVEQQLRTELARVKEETHSRIGEVSAEVGSVKSQVAASRLAMERTVAAMRRVNGELGVQSGLIATNRRELDALKSVGEKNYFEFNLARTKQPVKIADVAILLKKADAKRAQFSVDIVSGDKRLEKRERGLNEPLQFYVSKVKGPYEKVEEELYEVVVNEVRRDRIIGYLSTPRSR